MSAWSGFSCPRCGTRMPADSSTPRYRCDRCACETLDVVMDPAPLAGVSAEQWRAQAVDEPLRHRDERSIWRYQALLPVATPDISSGPLRDVGWTPLYSAPGIEKRLGLEHVWLKDDGRLPSGSFKDRASAVVCMRARELGVSVVLTASTGNAGVALAALARAAGLRALVLVPASAPPAKIAQLQVFGTDLYAVDGNYDDAFRLSKEAANQLGLYCRNTGYNPFTVEGKKTCAFEICEQLAQRLGEAGMRAPDRVYVSVGDGNIISGIHKGFRELLELGWIAKMPRMIGVQARGSAAIANAFETGGEELTRIASHSVADSICADMPADGLRAIRAVRNTGGRYVVVSDEAILHALVALARDGSVFAEPAAAAAYAGLLQQVELAEVAPSEHVVVVITGNGLKDVAAAEQATRPAKIIEPTLAALEQAMADSSEEKT